MQISNDDYMSKIIGLRINILISLSGKIKMLNIKKAIMIPHDRVQKRVCMPTACRELHGDAAAEDHDG